MADEALLDFDLLPDAQPQPVQGAQPQPPSGQQPVTTPRPVQGAPTKPPPQPPESAYMPLINHLEDSDDAAKRLSQQIGMEMDADYVVSPAGAIGRYQIMPSTAAKYGVTNPDDLFNPVINRRVANALLADLTKQYGNDPHSRDLIAIAYNAGSKRADAWKAAGYNDAILPPETRGYVERERAYYQKDPTQSGGPLDFDSLPSVGPKPAQGVAPRPTPSPSQPQAQPQAPPQSPWVSTALELGQRATAAAMAISPVLGAAMQSAITTLTPPPGKPGESVGALATKFVQNIPAQLERTGGAIVQAFGESTGREGAETELMTEGGLSPMEASDVMDKAGPAFQKPIAPHLAAWGSKVYADANAALLANAPNFGDDWRKRAAYQISSGLVTQAPFLIAGAVTKNPEIATAGIGVLGADIYADTYGASRAAGRTPTQARMDASVSTMAQVIPMSLPLGALWRPGQTFLGKTLQSGFGWSAQTVISGLLQAAYDKGELNDRTPWSEVLKRIGFDAGTNFVTGTIAGGVEHGMENGAAAAETRQANQVQEHALAAWRDAFRLVKKNKQSNPPTASDNATLPAGDIPDPVQTVLKSPLYTAPDMPRPRPINPNGPAPIMNAEDVNKRAQNELADLDAKASGTPAVIRNGNTLIPAQPGQFLNRQEIDRRNFLRANINDPAVLARQGYGANLLDTGPRVDPEHAAAVLDVALSRSPMPKAPSLFDAIRELGGIKPDDMEGKEVANLLRDYKTPPFKKRLLNPEGLNGDDMRAKLQERGWFGGFESQENREAGMRPGDNMQDLYDLIDREANGEPMYPPEHPIREELTTRKMLEREMYEAGVATSDKPEEAARKLVEFRRSWAAYENSMRNEDTIDEELAGLPAADRERLAESGYEPGADIGAEFEETGGPEEGRARSEDLGPLAPKASRVRGGAREGDRAAQARAEGEPAATQLGLGFEGETPEQRAARLARAKIEQAQQLPRMHGKKEQRGLDEGLFAPEGTKPLLHTAYHGSPYDFERFSNEAIGSGEGAQAFGYGHYFAGKKEVADFYREKLSRGMYPSQEALADYFRPGNIVKSYGGLDRVIAFHPEIGDRPWSVEVRAVRPKRDAPGEYEDIPGERIRNHHTAPSADEINAARRRLGLEPVRLGRLYHVELAPKEHEYLDWDRPFSEQSEGVRDAVKKLPTNVGELARTGQLEQTPGSQIYRYLASDLSPPERHDWGTAYTGFEGWPRASDALKEAGVPGIRYKDQLSRAAEGGSHNYVIFDPEHIRVEAKYQKGSAAEHEFNEGYTKIGHDLFADVPEAMSPSERKAADAVDRILDRIAPGAKKVATRGLRTAGGEAAHGAAFDTSGRGVLDAIAWSLGAPNVKAVARHEAVHYLRNNGFITEAEWNVLRKAAIEGDWISKHGIQNDYPGLSHEAQLEEAIADHYGLWKAAPHVVPEAVHPIFEKIGKFLASVADHFRRTFGMDATANDIFSRIESGEIGAREAAPAGGPEAPLLARAGRGAGPPRQRAIDRAMRQFDHFIGRTFDGTRDRIAGLAARAPDPIQELADTIKKGVIPMAAGDTPRYRAWATDFAFGVRQNMQNYRTISDYILKNFDAASRKRMWVAMDEEGVASRQGRSPDPTKGFASLNPEEYAMVKKLEDQNVRAAAIAAQYGMLPSPLIHYVPRMGIEMFAGRAAMLGRGFVGGMRGTFGPLGRNLRSTTPQLKKRLYMTTAETGMAMEARFGRGAQVVQDILTLPLATRDLLNAVQGRMLIERIRQVGARTGQNTVVQGGMLKPTEYFTLPHPAFTKWEPDYVTDAYGRRVARKDQNGDTVWLGHPLYVHKSFEGPLRAVLSQEPGMISRALMNVKGRQMSIIMFSPLMHNAVIYGRAFPAAPLKLLTPQIYKAADGWHFGIQLYIDGHRAVLDPDTVNEAINHGQEPIGRHFGMRQDILGIATADNIAPGRSWTSQVMAYPVDFFDPAAGDNVRRAIDTAGNFWHNTMLWDRVRDLQMGLYVLLRDRAIAHGIDPEAAKYFAAHFSNRYAGSMPMEAMSKAARGIANFMLFSRSYTLGTAGAWKDMVAGLPLNLQAKIREAAGPDGLEHIQGFARRKAATLIVGDILAAKISNIMAAGAIATAIYALTGTWRPNWPWNNERDKKNKVLVGHKPDGTAVYIRLGFGKTGEDLQDWGTQPLNTLHRKLSPIARVLHTVDANNQGFNRKLFDENDTSLGGDLDATANIGGLLADSWFPVGEYQFVHDLVTNQGDLATNIAGAALPAVGITVSRGAPGGPKVGAYENWREHQAYIWQEHKQEVMRLIQSGNIPEARREMRQLGVPAWERESYIKYARNPRARVNSRTAHSFIRAAPPEVRQEIHDAGGGNQ